MRISVRYLVSLIVVGGLFASCSSSQKYMTSGSSESSTENPRNPEEIQKLAEDVYIYGYPMVLMEYNRAVQTNVSRASTEGAPINQFMHQRRLADEKSRMASPELDVLSSSAWLDLSSEPVVLSVPDTGRRFYNIPILSAWTDVIGSPSSRANGNKRAEYLITGPGWRGVVPPGLTEIRSPTNTAWILGKIQTLGSKDTAAVRALQDRMRLTGLADWNQRTDPRRNMASTVDPAVDMSTAPVNQVESLSGVQFMEKLSLYLKRNPPKAEDTVLIGKMRRLGIIMGETFDGSSLSDKERQAINSGAQAALKKIVAYNFSNPGKIQDRGWVYSFYTGAYGADYMNRSAVAKYSLGAPWPQDVVTVKTERDANGMLLNGSNHYELRIAREDLPVSGSHWTLTAYDAMERPFPGKAPKIISSRGKLQRNADGSLSIVIQSTAPVPAMNGNWLAVVEGQNFVLNMRLYNPGPEVLNYNWRLPGVQQVQPTSGLSLR